MRGSASPAVFLLAALLLAGCASTGNPDPDVARLKAELEEARAELQEARQQLQNAEAVSENREDIIQELEDRVDELESGSGGGGGGGPTEEPTEEPPEPESGVVRTFRGSGIQSLRPFTVGDDWEVRWRADGLVFQIYLNTRGGDLVNIIANQQCPCRGKSFQANGGSYYLETNGDGSWTIEIVDI
jgi:hypothetical protein